MLISMLTLDTLESYDTIVFFAFFYSLLAGSRNKKNLITTRNQVFEIRSKYYPIP